MNNQSRVDGFGVRILDGREITAGEYEKLDSAAQAKVQSKVNGPHHSSKWAQDRAARRCLQHSFGKVFDKEHPVLFGITDKATYRVESSKNLTVIGYRRTASMMTSAELRGAK